MTKAALMRIRFKAIDLNGDGVPWRVLGWTKGQAVLVRLTGEAETVLIPLISLPDNPKLLPDPLKMESFSQFFTEVEDKGVAADKLYDLANQGHGRWIGSCGHVIKQCRCSAGMHGNLDMNFHTLSPCSKCR